MKLYIREPGSEQLARLVEDASNQFVVFVLTQVELRSAIRKRARMRDIDPVEATRLIEEFEGDLKEEFDEQLLSITILDIAKPLVDRNALRGYDAIQLAACLALRMVSDQAPTFVCADSDLLRAAVSERLEVLNPTD